MGFLDRVLGRRKPEEIISRVVLVTFGAVSQLTQACERDVKAKFGREFTEKDLQSAFLLFALFNSHLVERIAQGVVRDYDNFKLAFREQFIADYVKDSFLPHVTEAERTAFRRIVEPVRDELLAYYHSFPIPEGAGMVMPGSLPWEFGRKFAADLRLGDNEEAISVGMVGAMVSLKGSYVFRDVLEGK